MDVMTRPKPTTRVRKRNGAWCVLTDIVHSEHIVEYLVGTFDTWAVAFAVAQVEASPDVWPFYFRDLDHHIEECS